MPKRSQTLPNAPSSAPPPPNFPKILQELRKCATLYLTTGRRARDPDRARALTIPKNDSVSRANARNCARPIRRQPTARHARRNAAMSARIARQTGKKRVKTRYFASRIRPDDAGLQPARHEPISASPGRRTTPPRKKLWCDIWGHLGTFGDICPTFTPKRGEFGPMRQRRRMSAISVLQACKLCDQRPHVPGSI